MKSRPAWKVRVAGVVVAGVVVAGVVVAGVGAWAPWSGGQATEGGNGREVAAVPAVRVPLVAPTGASPAVAEPPAVPPQAPDGWIATLHSALGYSSVPGGPTVGSLPPTNPFGAPTVVALIGRPGADGWSHVELPIRPDGSTGWMQTATTTLTWTTYKVAVSLAARTLTVTQGSTTVLTAPVTVGAPSTATPTGATYLWELVAPDSPHGAYGPYIFGLGMFSHAIRVFNGGDAQIGIHGNDDASVIGLPVSHGCIRLHNAVIARLATMLPLGTPVTIS